MSELDGLEKMYKDILRIVYMGIVSIKTKAEEGKELSVNDIKAIEAYDKVTRNALDHYAKKPVENEYTKLSDEELEKELE